MATGGTNNNKPSGQKKGKKNRSKATPQRQNKKAGKKPANTPGAGGGGQKNKTAVNASEPAYAWSSFQNSPDPGELPIPSFAEEIFAAMPPAVQPASSAPSSSGSEDVNAMSEQLRSLLGVG